MVERLSEKLADLSARAKDVKDAAAAAQKESHDKLMARKEQARAAATTAIEKVNQEIKSASDGAARDWSAVKAKIAADMSILKAKVGQAKHDIRAERAEDYAEDMEWDAGFAVDFAIATVERARYAVLDAIIARAEADKARRV
jgi:hypothetical protein